MRFLVPDKNGKTKCHKLNVGANHGTCPILKVHDNTVMEEVSYDTYLGDIISTDGRNTRNIKKRIEKGLGIIADIINLLGMINLGEYYFETVTLLRESVF